VEWRRWVEKRSEEEGWGRKAQGTEEKKVP
jgi:hypothetical protein